MKKYTMEEFKKLYDHAVVETLEKVESDFIKAQGEVKTDNPMERIAFTMQNVLVMATLKHYLFEKESD